MSAANDLLPIARQSVSNRVELTGQLVPAPLIEDAAQMLACIWSCGLQHGVELADWRYVGHLPQQVVDVLVIAGRRRPRSDGD